MNFRFDLVQHFSSLEEIETQKCKVTSPKSHSGKLRVVGPGLSNFKAELSPNC